MAGPHSHCLSDKQQHSQKEIDDGLEDDEFRSCCAVHMRGRRSDCQLSDNRFEFGWQQKSVLASANFQTSPHLLHSHTQHRRVSSLVLLSGAVVYPVSHGDSTAV